MKITIDVTHISDVRIARQKAEELARIIGFDDNKSAEIGLVAGELASNLVKYANKGMISITECNEDGQAGMVIESIDNGPGILDIEQAMVNGYSTADSLGYGLGTVNRLMDEVDIQSTSESGTRITCKKWKSVDLQALRSCPLDIGVATRPHPRFTMNGDAFIIKKWSQSALAGVIDGLGHGQFAFKASSTARAYIEKHFDQSLLNIFQGVGRACRSTRGVVMALVRFNWSERRVIHASIGNITTKIISDQKPVHLTIRRGIIGVNAPLPQINEYLWEPGQIMILFSDGLTSRWDWKDFSYLASQKAEAIARELLKKLAKYNDDVTVLVVKEKHYEEEPHGRA
ncbi:MAG: ATP-binding protein [Candidatus Odinarchaeota archaeon]